MLEKTSEPSCSIFLTPLSFCKSIKFPVIEYCFLTERVGSPSKDKLFCCTPSKNTF